MRPNKNGYHHIIHFKNKHLIIKFNNHICIIYEIPTVFE